MDSLAAADQDQGWDVNGELLTSQEPYIGELGSKLHV
jgi:hypothetical protein